MDKIPIAEVEKMVQQVEQLLRQKKIISDQINGLFIEFNSIGMNKKVLKEIIKRRSKPTEPEEEDLLDQYRDLWTK